MKIKKKRKQSRKRTKWSRTEIIMLLAFISTALYQILDLVLR